MGVRLLKPNPTCRCCCRPVLMGACFCFLFLVFCCTQISGLLGHAARGEKKSPAVADSEVGIGGCCQWRLQGLDHDTTVAVLFEVTGSGQSAGDQGGQVCTHVPWWSVCNLQLCLSRGTCFSTHMNTCGVTMPPSLVICLHVLAYATHVLNIQRSRPHPGRRLVGPSQTSPTLAPPASIVARPPVDMCASGLLLLLCCARVFVRQPCRDRSCSCSSSLATCTTAGSCAAASPR